MKHKLRLDELEVESFATGEDARAQERGTVRGLGASNADTCNATCDISCAVLYTCPATCLRTCDDGTCPDSCPATCDGPLCR